MTERDGQAAPPAQRPARKASARPAGRCRVNKRPRPGKYLDEVWVDYEVVRDGQTLPEDVFDDVREAEAYCATLNAERDCSAEL